MPFKPNFDKEKSLKYIVDHPLRIIIPIFLITLFLAFQIPHLRFQTSIYDLAIEDISETIRYKAFKKEFGTEEIILVVAKAKNIFEPETFQKIDQLSQFFSEIKGVKRVISLPTIKKDMDVTDKWTLADFEKIIAPIELLHKNLISADKKTTAISLILEDIEPKDSIIESVREIIEKEGKGVSLYQIGMPLVSEALAEYTEKDFLTLPSFTFLVIAVILLFFFRSIQGILIPIGSVLIALIWTFGFMAWTRTPLSMLIMIVPILIIAVGTAYCMYTFSEYLDSIKEANSPKEVAYRCFLRVRFPISLAVITTIIGLGSLILNKISGIRDFALFSCFGILSMLIIIRTLLPAVLALLPFPITKNAQLFPKQDLWERLLLWIVKLNLHHQKTTLSIMAFVTLIGIIGIFFIKVETNPVGFFKKDTAISQHFHDIYRDMAGSFPINVVMDSKTDSFFENPDHLQLISRIQIFLESLAGVDTTISSSDYLKLVNYATNQYKPEYYAIPEQSFEVRMLMNSYKSMLGQDMFDRFMNEDLSKAKIMLRTHISSSRDFLQAKKEIQEYLQKNLPEDFQFQVTGFGIVISQSSHLLTKGQAKSLSLTLVLIFGVMLLLFLSGKAAFIALAPNCFPIIINFGLMGWLGIELSVATSLIACIAIGLAVDDTIHYLFRYNSEFKKDLDKDRALRDTLKSVGRPVIFTTLAISLGFSVLIFSHFKPTAVFGLMMVITMFSALVGDLIILPSLMLHVELVTAWDLLKLMPTLVGMPDNLVHELNQPLNAIKMGSEFLKMMIQRGEKIPPEHLSQVVNEISLQVDRTSEIINRSREFGQRLDFTKEKVYINKPIKNVFDIIGHQLSLENIELNLDLDEKIPPILAHNNRLGQVIFNLVTNARDAIDRKKKAGISEGLYIIKIRSFQEDDHVVMTVSDNGIGIPKTIRNRIFELFFTTKELGKGKGLGLSIVYQIIKDYGGRIEVHSKEGVETIFKVVFPSTS